MEFAKSGLFWWVRIFLELGSHILPHISPSGVPKSRLVYVAA